MSQSPFLKEIDERFAAIEATAVGNALPSAEIIVGSAGGVSAAVAMSGDVTISNTGVTTIGAAKVTTAKLATVLQPSHVVKFAGTFTTVGGDANEAIPAVGALATDVALVFLKTAGVAPVTVLSAAAAVDAINVVMSADPDDDHVLSYVVFRAV